MIKAICFDLDGTLVTKRSSFDFTASLLAGFKQLGIEARHHNVILETLSYKLLNENIANSTVALLSTLSDLGLPTPPNLETVIKERNQAYFDACELMTGAKDLLDDLKHKNIPLALITNGPADMQLGVLKQLKLEPYFRVVLASGEVGIRKPDQRIFDLALEKLKSKASETLMVGDNPEADIQGALDAGLQALQIGNREPKSDVVKHVQNVPELHNYLKSILP